MWYVGRRYGIRVDGLSGWWVSLGVHIHVWPPHKAHLDLHLLWWLITFGRHYGGPKKKEERTTMTEYAPIPHDPIPAEIIETPTRENGYYYRAHTFLGQAHFLRGLGAPEGGHAGQHGTLQYRTGPGYGRHFWASKED